MADKSLSALTTSATIVGTDLMYFLDGPNSRAITFANIVSGVEAVGMSAAAITSGTFNDARVAESNVTQHEAAITITESQISDLQSYLTSYTETDPVVGAVTGIVKADGAGAISAATAGTDYYAPSGTDVAVADGGTGASTAADARANLGIHDLGPNAQTGTTYTLVLADRGLTITMDNGSANTLTIPANASVAFDVGTVINVIQIGAGVTTIEGDTGVTVNGVSAGSGDINTRYQGVSLLKVATDTWIASGDIATVA